MRGWFGLFAALCAAACASADVKKVQPSDEADCPCVPASGLCEIHYNNDWYARFPNARDQGFTDALREFLDFRQLLSLNNYCSHMLYNLLCFHYFPKCDPPPPSPSPPQRQQLHHATPCRETCIEALTACIDQARSRNPNYEFPAHLNCSNFPSGSGDCDVPSEGQCSTQCPACPNASIHLEFVTELGPSEPKLIGSEASGSVAVHLRLANVGSYDSEAVLTENVTVLITTAPTTNLRLARAEAGVDYVPLQMEVEIPVGSRKGFTRSIEIEIPCDDIDESNEYFEVVANITSPSDAKFGGAAHSTTGSILVEIQNQYPPPTKTPSPPTPSPSPESCIPDDECSSQDCNWRTSISRNTFVRNDYTFVALVEVVECGDSVVVVNILECHNISTCGMCPLTTSTLTICSNCISSCSTGEVVLAGLHDDCGSLYITNTKKGGLFVSVIRSNWREFLPSCPDN